MLKYIIFTLIIGSSCFGNNMIRKNPLINNHEDISWVFIALTSTVINAENQQQRIDGCDVINKINLEFGNYRDQNYYNMTNALITEQELKTIISRASEPQLIEIAECLYYGNKTVRDIQAARFIVNSLTKSTNNLIRLIAKKLSGDYWLRRFAADRDPNRALRIYYEILNEVLSNNTENLELNETQQMMFLDWTMENYAQAFRALGTSIKEDETYIKHYQYNLKRTSEVQAQNKVVYSKCMAELNEMEATKYNCIRLSKVFEMLTQHISNTNDPIYILANSNAKWLKEVSDKLE